MEMWQLQQRQSMPLEAKIIMTQQRIKEWYEYWDGNVYVAFSGGKDSTVLLHLVRQLYPNVSAVFCNTGLEYPEIVQFVRQTENVIWLKPKISFREVLDKYGYPIISKMQAAYIQEYRETKSEILKNIRLNGVNGNYKISNKWLFLINAPFKISDRCCDIMKRNPFKEFNNKNNLKAIVGIMANDSSQRKKQYLLSGCNAFDLKISKPISFWLEQDVWEYIKLNDITYSPIYDMGYKRTGCSFCMFGLIQEGTPNRFQLMKNTHPKLYKYCMEELDLDRILTYCKIEH